MNELERVFIDYRIRRRIKVVIIYYFQHRDELSVVKLLTASTSGSTTWSSGYMRFTSIMLRQVHCRLRPN